MVVACGVDGGEKVDYHIEAIRSLKLKDQGLKSRKGATESGL